MLTFCVSIPKIYIGCSDQSVAKCKVAFPFIRTHHLISAMGLHRLMLGLRGQFLNMVVPIGHLLRLG